MATVLAFLALGALILATVKERAPST
jgi:hypothetical protein